MAKSVYVSDIVLEGKGKGRETQQAVALVREVQDRLELEAQLGASRAEALLIARRERARPRFYLLGGKDDNSHSKIVVESGDIDRYVILDDTDGRGAANVIEFGRPGARGFSESFDDEDPDLTDGRDMYFAMEGTYVLSDAMKIGRGKYKSFGDSFD